MLCIANNSKNTAKAQQKYQLKTAFSFSVFDSMHCTAGRPKRYVRTGQSVEKGHPPNRVLGDYL